MPKTKPQEARMSSDLPVVQEKPQHSLETITAKLQEDPRNIDAAIAVLGASGFFHESNNSTHTKLYQFVTGINIQTGKQQSQHPRRWRRSASFAADQQGECDLSARPLERLLLRCMSHSQ